jgi:hypothetical protein
MNNKSIVHWYHLKVEAYKIETITYRLPSNHWVYFVIQTTQIKNFCGRET